MFVAHAPMLEESLLRQRAGALCRGPCHACLRRGLSAAAIRGVTGPSPWFAFALVCHGPGPWLGVRSTSKYTAMYDRPGAPLRLKVRLLQAEVVETLLYG
ncbi:unnamed protein product, partial [Pylaiella littoralis]